ncbi:MAG: 2-oxoglutarate dehydrogenase E1 component [Thiobacillus sp. 63-78]|uniref:2-oxoglutarate dehydrogenase E1 component n=1 Tax=Thiobacillus sp. 63-78 TaxID=1895859 RepID=UPI0009631E86|nr:2-oxoglutarate dehydrogenase E1 component [Thiobacillus sp. 63-78]MBN8763108.1 2-oxoglutarate dehydrogenase E1 component [Thiobacillus sp.]MBN8774801.1 2-oxoglutarate dehydrogenase E1 component [Thiobacillus sp.]OJZ16644.1 MAG: 2-oxoglutarate dehydrogenase E1 component [Thiobacillus sp. 63-78]
MSASDWRQTSPLYAGNAAYLEQFGDDALTSWLAQPLPDAAAGADAAQVAVLRLINAYRYLGVRQAELDPLRRFEPPLAPELDPAHYGLTEADLAREFETGSLFGVERTTLADILQRLDNAYCGHVGVDYMHITDVARKRWLQERIESARGRFGVSGSLKKQLLKRLTDAETLEKFLHTRHVGQKRFSLEGAESLIPLLDQVIARCARHGAKEIVMGMAHRGRINVLANIMGCSLESLYEEPRNGYPDSPLSGDVKYHQGFSSDIATPYGPVHLALAFNPSHLEVVHPVVRGSVRARQDRRGDVLGYEVVPVILHGDAALSGQGVVMESLNMSQTRGFRNGGAIHIVINNQIGFTTSDPRDVRSTLYCTDVAKMVEAPVLHVNGDDPEAVAFAVQTAVDFRYTFHKNCFIDLVCYRRHGHNEQDEPLATQPLMYRRIQAHPSTRVLYAQRLVEEGVLTQSQVDDMVDDCRERLEHDESLNSPALSDFKATYGVDWSRFKHGDPGEVPTAISASRLDFLGERITTLQHEIELHSRVQKVLDDRRRMRAGELPVDWGYAENLAYASLLDVGYNVRVSGQDSARGTFFHRHAVWHDQKRERRQSGVYVPLEHVQGRQGDFTIIDSLLSEEAVLAFEYGYATADPDTLVVWEAQFGDFANGAQVVIDQFITSGEAKWGRLCGLTLMLPHGFEGQGPEHSSARLERYLQLCAQDNIQVCVPTLPAQMFHLLRRQLVRPLRKPLVIMSPKSLLRHPASTSALTDLSDGAFLPVIDDPRAPREASRIVVCSGRVWFDLEAARAARGLETVALIRIEQLYPFPEAGFCAVLNAYPRAATFVWAQEEPMNQGAWYQTLHHLNHCLPGGRRFHYAGRPPAAAPASGYVSRHRAELETLLNDALETSYEA